MKIRAYLALLVLACVLPIMLFAGIMADRTYREQRKNLEERMIERTRAIAAALDREFLITIQSLKLLGTSKHLEKGNFRDFYDDMGRALEQNRTSWQNLTLTDAAGQQLINLRRPFGASLPKTGNPQIIEAIRIDKKPVIANLSPGPVTGELGAVVHVPVIKDGAVKYVLNAVFSLQPLTTLLLQQKFPQGWVATVIDGNQVVVARTHNLDKFFGKPVSATFGTRAKQYREATWRGVTLDGSDVFAALQRSDLSAWTVAMASPVEEVYGPLRRTLVLNGLVGGLTLLIAFALAAYIGRKVAEPISAIARAADKLGRGEPAPVPSSKIDEIQRLAQGLGNAALRRAEAEKELRYQLQFVRNITEKSAECIFASDLSGGVTFLNPEAERTFGFSLADFSGKTMHAAIHHHYPDGRPFPAEECVLAQIRSTGRTVRNHEDIFFRKDGSPVAVEVSNALLEVNGQRIGAVLMARDITDRKRSEARIRHLNRVYVVLSGINEAIVRIRDPQALISTACQIAVDKGEFRMAWIGLVNSATGRVEPKAVAGVNDGYVENLDIVLGDPSGGRGPTGWVVREGKHIVCNDIGNDPRMARWREAALRRGYMSRAGFPLKIGNETVGIFSLYSAERNFFNSAELSLLDELAADISLALEIHRHESEKLRAETSLRESEQRFRQLAENISEVFWLSTPDKSRVIYVSPAYELIWGRTCQSLYDAPRAWVDAVHPDDRGRVVDAALSDQASGGYDQEYRIVRPDGGVRWVRDRAFPVRDGNNRIYRIAGIAEDITARKETEDALKRSHEELEEKVIERTRDLLDANLKLKDLDRVKSQFLANMSHELRTPLNAIIGFSQLMHDGKVGGPLSEIHKEYLGDILSSAAHLLHLIDDILDLAKVESGRMELQHSTFGIDEVISEVARSISPSVAAKNLALVQEIPGDVGSITTDRRKLLQILLNLASNAVKFTNAGEISIRCRRLPGAIQVSVSDTGIGIKAEDLPLLFHAFTQIDDSLRKRHIGTGLGLFLSKRLANLLDGEIVVESEYGKGSTFRLDLPIALACRTSTP